MNKFPAPLNVDGLVVLNVSHDEETMMVHLMVRCASHYDAMLFADDLQSKINGEKTFMLRFEGRNG